MKISEAADHHPVLAQPAGRTGPMAVGRVLALLQLLASPDAPCSLARLSLLLDAPKPSVLSLLNELVALGYARRAGRGFELGPRAYRLGLQLLSVDSVGRLVRDGLRDLSDELGMTVALGYLDRDRRALVYADRYEAAGPVRYVVQLGTPLSIHSRALGRLLLSYEPEEDWRHWLGDAPYPAFTPATTTDYDSLAAELRRIRRDGLAKTASEQFEDIGSIAMPVFDAEGLVACGIAAQTAVPALEARGARVVAALRATAALLGKALAARGIARATLARHL